MKTIISRIIDRLTPAVIAYQLSGERIRIEKRNRHINVVLRNAYDICFWTIRHKNKDQVTLDLLTVYKEGTIDNISYKEAVDIIVEQCGEVIQARKENG